MGRGIYCINNVYKPRMHILLTFEQVLFNDLNGGSVTLCTPLSFWGKKNEYEPFNVFIPLRRIQ